MESMHSNRLNCQQELDKIYEKRMQYNSKKYLFSVKLKSFLHFDMARSNIENRTHS